MEPKKFENFVVHPREHLVQFTSFFETKIDFLLKIQILGGKTIYAVNCTRSARGLTSKFSNFLGGDAF